MNGLVAGRHQTFEHVALVHDGPDELIEQLVVLLHGAIARDEPALVCVDQDVWRRVAERVDGLAEGATFVPPSVRNRRPTGAMRSVHEFARRALAGGATKVWTIGTIDYAEDDAGRWRRYEAAVDDVLGHLPIGAVCTFDVRALEDPGTVAAHAHHGSSNGAIVPTTVFVDTAALPAPLLDIDEMSSTFRHDLSTALAATGVDDTVLEDVQLVATELLTNAHRHGEPPIRLRCWRRAGDIVLEATDHGAGLVDPYPDLRPPQPGLTGYGFWLIGQLVDEFSIERTADGRTVVTVGVDVG